MLRFLLVLIALLVLGGSAKIQEPAHTGQASANSTGNEVNDTTSLFSPVWSSENKRVARVTGRPGMGYYEEFYPCDVGLQAHSWDDVSIEEKMLAWGYEILDENGESFDTPVMVHPLEVIGSLLSMYFKENGSLPESSQELFDWELERVKKWFEKGLLEDAIYESFDSFEAHFLTSLISPVTGELIEWNNLDFSRGNVFVTVINDHPQALEAARERYTESWNARPEDERSRKPGPDRLDDATFVYMRAYGESGVLGEFTSASFSKKHD